MISCSPKKTDHTSVDARTQSDQKHVKEEAEFFNFVMHPNLNRLYNYSTKTSTIILQELNGLKEQSKTETELLFNHIFKRDSANAGDYFLSSTIKKFAVDIETPTEVNEVDAATAASSYKEEDHIFAAFHNAILNTHIDTLGNVKSVEGVTEIKNKMYQLANGNPDIIESINNGSVKQYLTEPFFKHLTEQNFKFISSKALKPGDTIQKREILQMDFPINITSVYKLTSLTNHVAHFEITADISIQNQSIQYLGTSVDIDIEGEQNGEIEIDANTGLFLHVKSEQRMKGKISAKSVEIPITINVTSETKLLN